MIRFFERSKINSKAWDACIEASVHPSPYAFSSYLDLVSPGWGAFIIVEEGEDLAYAYAMPVQFEWKVIRIIRQSPYSFQLGVFSRWPVSEEIYALFLQKLTEMFAFVSEYRFYEQVPGHLLEHFSNDVQVKKNQVLDTSRSYGELKAGYNSNRKRDLKKAFQANLELNVDGSLETFIQLFDQFTRDKIQHFHPSQYVMLRSIVALLKKNDCVRIVEVLKDGLVIASAIFYEKAHFASLSMATNSPEALSCRASTFLLDRMIKEYTKQKIAILSFNGSEDEGVSSFYASFGARDENYTFLRYSKLPPFVNKALAWIRRMFYPKTSE